MAYGELISSAELEDVERRFETIITLHKYGAYLSFQMLESQNEAKVLFFPTASHCIVSSKWSKLVSKKETPCLKTIIKGFQQPLYSQTMCHLYLKGDDHTKIAVRAYVVDEIQDGIDVVFGCPFENYVRICKVEREADNIRFDIWRQVPYRRFRVTIEGILLPKQDMRLPLKLPCRTPCRSDQMCDC